MSLKPRRGLGANRLVRQILAYVGETSDRHWCSVPGNKALHSACKAVQCQPLRQPLPQLVSPPVSRLCSITSPWFSNKANFSTLCRASATIAGISRPAVHCRFLHSAYERSEAGDRQQAAYLLAALCGRRKSGQPSFLSELLGSHTPRHQPPHSPSSPAFQHPLNPQQQQQQQQQQVQRETASTAQMPESIEATAAQLNKLVAQQPGKCRSTTKTQLSKAAVAQLQERLYNILQHAASQVHWRDNTPGFLACLEDVRLLFQQIFSPADSRQKPEHCCSVEPTAVTVTQCLDSILPVLLLPQQAPAHNMVSVAEFLQDMMGMTGTQAFKCFVEEPSVLYLDVYTDLLPLQDFFDALNWEPADYREIVVKHPQILLLPLRQFQRNIGYLLGQRVPKAEILCMLHLRAGLLIEPLQNLHGEVLALRAANRPLQDLALPVSQRAAPLPDSARGDFKPCRTPVPPALQLNDPSHNSKLRIAVTALAGTPQAVYLYRQNNFKAAWHKGVQQNVEGQFVAKAPVGQQNAVIKVGVYPTLLAAAQAYDKAILTHYGTVARSRLNFPADNRSPVSTEGTHVS